MDLFLSYSTGIGGTTNSNSFSLKSAISQALCAEPVGFVPRKAGEVVLHAELYVTEIQW